MKRSIIIVILTGFALAGCGTLDGKLQNRVACTVAKDKAYAVSEYGPIGITGKIADNDTAVICK